MAIEETTRREMFGRTVKELADIGVASSKTIYGWIRKGELEAALIGGKFYVTDQQLEDMRLRKTTSINAAEKSVRKMLA